MVPTILNPTTPIRNIHALSFHTPLRPPTTRDHGTNRINQTILRRGKWSQPQSRPRSQSRPRPQSRSWPRSWTRPRWRSEKRCHWKSRHGAWRFRRRRNEPEIAPTQGKTGEVVEILHAIWCRGNFSFSTDDCPFSCLFRIPFVMYRIFLYVDTSFSWDLF